MTFPEHPGLSYVETVLIHTASLVVCTGHLEGFGETESEALQQLRPLVDEHALQHHLRSEPLCVVAGSITFSQSQDSRPVGSFD